MPVGPSPRAWGLQGGLGGPQGPDRAIPTCVGTTLAPTTTTPSRLGPSPRAWGLPGALVGLRGGLRAIPTCVGTTAGPFPPSGHPHVRGDYMGGTPGTVASAGPSPRAWGLRQRGDFHTGGERAIPTCVGTTGRGTSSRWQGPGHPHVRGDYKSSPQNSTRPTGHPHVRGDYVQHGKKRARCHGPSPRAWGLLGENGDGPDNPRAIPTCVGTTAD